MSLIISFSLRPQFKRSTTMDFIVRLSVVFVIMSLMVSLARADKAQDKQECTEQLVGLATCLPYVGGEAKAPTPDCCSGLKQVIAKNKKCLCVIVRDRNDPDLGLNINATLALGLPSVCNTPADVTKCPALLNLDPKSPEAQVFYQFANSTNNAAGSPAPSASKGSPTSGSSTATNAQDTSDATPNGMGRLWVQLTGGVLLWSSTSFLHTIFNEFNILI